MDQSIENKPAKPRKSGPKNPAELSRLKNDVVSKLYAGFSYTGAAFQVGIQRNTIKDWRDKDQQFDADCQEARESATERVEDALYEAAMKVKADPRYTTAAIFFLKNRAPARWRDVQDIRQTNDVQRVVESLGPEQLRRLASNLEIDLGHEAGGDISAPQDQRPGEASHSYQESPYGR